MLIEEEMILNSAYRVAALDEERVLNQKTKLEWLKEGDHNSAYFHNILKVRKNKSRIVSVKDDMGNEFQDEHLAEQKLMLRRIYTLVKEVSTKEIKTALFDIYDDKAPGPYGFTFKFLKSSWDTVRKDLCASVKEFFSSGKMLEDLNTTFSCSQVIKIVHNELIDPNQSAFVEGRRICDNIMLAQELMCGYMSKNKVARFGFHQIMVG
ncbi:hypothetical protein Tco_1308928 [Tanacetum coccineum]